MKYKVKITETLEKVVEIDADNEREALTIAECNYRAAKDDYILTAENFTDTDFEVLK